MPGTARPELPRKRGVAVYCALIVLAVSVSAFWRLSDQRTFERPSAPAPRLQLDPNVAPWSELAALPEIGESLARRIVSYRESQQAAGNPRPFRSLSDLDAVSGIGPATLANLEPYLAF